MTWMMSASPYHVQGYWWGMRCLPGYVVVPQDCDATEDQRRQQQSENTPAHKKAKAMGAADTSDINGA